MRALLDFVFPPQCGGCERIGSGLCDSCLPRLQRIQRKLPTLNVSALGIYEGSLRRAILALKSGRRDVAEAFAERLYATVPANLIVPVPTTAARRRERGFDGCELIARLAFEKVTAGLVQVRGETQRGRDREERLVRRQRFAWRGPQLAGTTVTLLDDVVTTGATLESCAAIVRDAGGIVTEALALATVPALYD